MINNKGYFVEVWYGRQVIGYLGTNPANESPITRHKLPILTDTPLRYQDWDVAQRVINLAHVYGNTKLTYYIRKPRSCILPINRTCYHPEFTTDTKVKRKPKPKKTREQEYKEALYDQAYPTHPCL